jgi:hypothetical protein
MKRLIYGSIVPLLLAVLIGCSGFDTSQVLVHPETAKPSETFDVALLNLYAYLANGTTVPAEVVRDSLHLLVGMPEGWEVVEASMALVDDLPVEALFALQNSVFDEAAMSAILQEYQSGAVPVAVDGMLPGALSGQTFNAHSVTADTDIAVAIDDIPSWAGFSAPVNIVIEAGSTDTGIALDSVLSMAEALDMLDDSLQAQINALRNFSMVPDTIGVSMVPIALYLKIKAGDAEGEDTLYYFSKTAQMNPETSQMVVQMMPDFSDLELGDMTYVPVTVSNSAAVSSERRHKARGNITVNSTSGTVHISLNNESLTNATIEIFNLQGNLINVLFSYTGGKTVVWDGRDTRGVRAGTGTYLVKVTGGGITYAKAVHLIN